MKPLSDDISQLGYLAGATRFRRISEKLHTDGDQIYRDSGIDFKASWFPVFYLLSVAETPKTVVELAEAIGYTHITVKNVVRELENKGLVKIASHPTDRRAKHISLSPKGKRLLNRLAKIWVRFGSSLKHLLDAGHPDFLRMIGRIETELSITPLRERFNLQNGLPEVRIVDYKPSLKRAFYDLAGPWLLGLLEGKLEKEDKFTINNPDKAYLPQGGFLFFALIGDEVVGCVALKRLDEDTFEFAKLFVDPKRRNLGIASKLIERCITRCRENDAKQLWLQTTMRMPDAHRLYYKLGFQDRKAPKQMAVLNRTEKIMVMDL